MKRTLALLAVTALLTLGACGSLPKSVSPEQQIRDGSNAITATATIAGSLLTVDKITKDQAVSYRAILGTASKHLDTAFATLAACRAKTGSSPATSPDPCRPTVQADIELGISVAAEVKKTLDAKK